MPQPSHTYDEIYEYLSTLLSLASDNEYPRFDNRYSEPESYGGCLMSCERREGPPLGPSNTDDPVTRAWYRDNGFYGHHRTPRRLDLPTQARSNAILVETVINITGEIIEEHKNDNDWEAYKFGKNRLRAFWDLHDQASSEV